MKILSLVFLICILGSCDVNSQIAGVYYLDDVMETASGFKLNSDSTFEFFFSYGALDRTGDGTWSVSGSNVILQSQGKLPAGFFLSKSEVRKGNKNIIVVKESNSMLLSFISARFLKENNAFTPLDETGSLEISKNKFEAIELHFELCPERSFSFSPVHIDDNYFEFTMDPEIMKVYFDHLNLKSEKDALKGPHPLLKDNIYTFSRQE